MVLHRMTFKRPVAALGFSPDGPLIAVGLGKLVHIWRSPVFRKELFPFQLERTLPDCAGAVTALDWSPDSKYLLAGSKDLTVRFFRMQRLKGSNKPFLFLGHREAIVGAFF
ncbi:putative Periodic tryptophan protein 2 [Cocos nucifera]|uniref:Putative Periodic tryptophan protein 2 n=1 Tax=Cocos nucifera TaxID=13894 RepID=A0A8K0IA76_COCNU|nr:putative Periodic tryptophan protein 2 [Cocos nucifera]